MITFEINKPNVDTTPFRVKGHQTISGKKIDIMFVCYADNETAAKEIFNEYKMTKLVKYNMRTLAKKI